MFFMVNSVIILCEKQVDPFLKMQNNFYIAISFFISQLTSNLVGIKIMHNLQKNSAKWTTLLYLQDILFKSLWYLSVSSKHLKSHIFAKRNKIILKIVLNYDKLTIYCVGYNTSSKHIFI